MIETVIGFVAYSALLAAIAYQVGHTRGYELGLDDAAQMIFGLPVVWP